MFCFDLPLILPASLPLDKSCRLRYNQAKRKRQEDKAMTRTIYVDGMMCKKCAARVEKALSALSGVAEAKVDLEAKNAAVTLSGEVSDQVLMDAVAAAGYTPVRCE